MFSENGAVTWGEKAKNEIIFQWSKNNFNLT
jgi:hypothetical protein